MIDQDMGHAVEAVRRFTRFYTRRIGILEEHLLGSPFSLAEARVIYELANRDSTTASELARELSMDPGYLSRIMKRFERRGLIHRRPSTQDARQNVVDLTDKGQASFAQLNARSAHEIAGFLDRLTPEDQNRLVEAMAVIQQLLEDQPPRPATFILRPHQVGDMGWVVHRQGLIYAREYGWDGTFEALVAEIVSKFVREFDPSRERCWIAEKDGRNVGSVFLVKQSDEVAKLRLLFVDPQARGLGLGRRLVDECLNFARSCGYRKITLWTNDILTAARRIYQQAGFRLAEEEPHHSFGHDLVGQYWERDL